MLGVIFGTGEIEPRAVQLKAKLARGDIKNAYPFWDDLFSYSITRYDCDFVSAGFHQKLPNFE